MDQQEIIANISRLFLGSTQAHGVFNPEGFVGKKQNGRSITVREEITADKWKKHLEGRIGLGIIPINENSNCNWAAVDIDNYELDFNNLLERLYNSAFVVCKSKSGGVHLYVFFDPLVSAREAREYLRNQVATIGLGNNEIFPKQEKIIAIRGDAGNWINMPYFGESRKCIVLRGTTVCELSIEEFLVYANNKKISLKEIDNKGVNYELSVIKDGPPCLQVLSLSGFPPHTRNLGLYNLGIYAQRAFPTTWQKKMEEYNKQLFGKDFLPFKEVETIVKSLDKKGYSYKCHDEPICSFCNPQLCRTRRYGISATSAMPIVNSVTKIAGDFSVWFIDVEGGRLEMTTDELYDNRKFLLKCVNALNILPNKMKAEQWSSYLQTQILDKAIVIHDDSMFKRSSIPEYFGKFLMARITDKLEEVSNGRVYYHKKRLEVQFKMEAFINYMRYNRVDIDKGWLVMYFKTRGAKIGVGKDNERKSFRYTTLQVTDEEMRDIDAKLRMTEVI